MRLAAILFDKDGTLVDFDRTWGAAAYAVMKRLSAGDENVMGMLAQVMHYGVAERRFRPTSPFIAGAPDTYVHLWAEALRRPNDAAMLDDLNGHFAEETLAALTPIGAPLDVLDALHRRGLKLGLATNDAERSARAQLAKLGLDARLDFVVGYDSGHGGKPAPGMVLAFARHVGVPPAEIALVGDSAADLKAARAAGAIAIAVLTGPAERDELAPLADHVIDGLTDLPALVDRLGGDRHVTTRGLFTTFAGRCLVIAPALLDTLRARLGPAGLLTDAGDLEPFLAEARGVLKGAALAVALPRTTAEVSSVVGEAARAGVPVIPQGGNTGLVVGTARAGAGLILSLTKMNRVRSLDALDAVVTVEAGATLKAVRDAADAVGCLFPLSLASEGSAQIGGLVATNAGGTAVLRHGNMRDLVLGLEVVLADGRVWNGLKRLRKDNTGYDLKQLFIGSEGTLGIVTAATLKLVPRPKGFATAFVGVDSPRAALALLGRVRGAAPDALTAFELIPAFAQHLVLKHMPNTRAPLAGPHPWAVLIELSAARPDHDSALIEALLGDALEAGEVADAAVAQSEAQRAQFWAVRENITEALKHEGASIKHDVAVPVSRIADFLDRATALVAEAMPGARICAFGHLGDGNIHFNLSQPPGASRAAFLEKTDRINRLVHDLAVSMEGSFAADPVFGRARRDELLRLKDEVSLDLMRRLKAALDPAQMLNPGAVL